MAGPKAAGSGKPPSAAVLAARKAAAAAAKKAKAASGGGGKGGKAAPAGKSKTVGGKRPREETTEAPRGQLSNKEKKEAVRAKKMKMKPNFATIQEITMMWEKMRPAEVAESAKAKTVLTIMEKVKGRITDLAMSHTASRVMQACAKHGDAKVRSAILGEVKGRLLEMAKSSYGNFVIRKLINLAPKSELAEIQKAFKGRIPELMRHPCGSAVVIDLYAAASTEQRNCMAAEFYGREFQLFDAKAGDAAHSLTERMSGMTATQRKATLQHLTIQLSPIMEKGLLDSELVHRLVWEYIENSSEVTMAEVVDNLSGPFMLRMVHTRNGARASCAVLRAAAAKDRKKVVKAMKENVASLAADEYGHVVLIAALSVVDDTALLRKMIVAPLQAMLPGLLEHKYGRRVVLQLLAPFHNRYLPVEYQEWVRPSSEEGKTTSLKDPVLRRRELLGSGEGSLAAQLVGAVEGDLAGLLSSFTATDCVLEVARGGEDGLLEEAEPEGVKRVRAAIAQLAAEPRPGEGAATTSGGEEDDAAAAEGTPSHVLLDYVPSRTLRRLLLAGGEGGGSGAFAEALWADALQGRCAQWVGSHADKVLAALTHCHSPSVVAAASKELSPLIAGGKTPGGKKGTVAGKDKAAAGALEAWAATHGLANPKK
mmetsp:Transcript_9410/g.23839  ORF Transcript_9410/g.23839 Transcript_9410/m.23839 type:complete len:652 (-) Transcript_9410:138-2093(-)